MDQQTLRKTIEYRIQTPLSLDYQRNARARLNGKLKVFHSERWAWKLIKEMGMPKAYRNFCLESRFFGDFVWPEFKIVLEIDGKSHDGKAEYDARRDGYLRECGWLVLRVAHGNESKLRSKLEQILELMGHKAKMNVDRRREKNNLRTQYTLKRRQLRNMRKTEILLAKENLAASQTPEEKRRLEIEFHLTRALMVRSQKKRAKHLDQIKRKFLLRDSLLSELSNRLRRKWDMKLEGF